MNVELNIKSNCMHAKIGTLLFDCLYTLKTAYQKKIYEQQPVDGAKCLISIIFAFDALLRSKNATDEILIYFDHKDTCKIIVNLFKELFPSFARVFRLLCRLSDDYKRKRPKRSEQRGCRM